MSSERHDASLAPQDRWVAENQQTKPRVSFGEEEEEEDEVRHPCTIRSQGISMPTPYRALQKYMALVCPMELELSPCVT